MSKRLPRVGVWASHPIQYAAPWFRHLARAVDLEVFYAHRQSAAGQAGAGFGVEFEWDVPLLDGYRHRWLHNIARADRVAGFRGCDTPEVASIVGGGGFDAFVIFGWNHRSAIQTMRACRRHRVPVLMRGDSQLATPRSTMTRAAKGLVFPWALERWVDGHLYVGRRNRQYLERYGVPADKLFFVPHAVDTSFFRDEAERARQGGRQSGLRADLGIPAEAFVFLFAGKLIDKKRPRDLVEAWRRLRASGAGDAIHVVFVGDGPWRGGSEALAAEGATQVHFAGFRNQSELPAVYAACDALVLPSDARETWGLVVNEAAACGLPSVVSDAAGCSDDLVVPGLTGFSYPVGDVRALADRMLAVKQLSEHRESDMRAGLRAVTATYSYETATGGVLQAMERVVHGRRRSLVAAGD